MIRLLEMTRRALGAVIMTILMALPGVSADETSPATPGHSGEPAFTNRLIDAQAPYLLLHAHNPVDWYPWGPEAFARAKAEDKPIFLSVGYSTCFWCHVAERTLYQDPEIAALMNKWFINVKVDREQRPDVDHVYMLARQIIAGSGGWPNNVFLTPDLEAFFAGSYFPPERDARGRPSFADVLERIHNAWTRQRGQVLQTASQVGASLRQVQAAGAPSTSGVELDTTAVRNDAIRALLRGFDPVHGGFGGRVQRTKFPQSPTLQLLLTEYRQSRDPFVAEALRDTLEAIAFGGIHDHLAGGFHRYSTDPEWSPGVQRQGQR